MGIVLFQILDRFSRNELHIISEEPLYFKDYMDKPNNNVLSATNYQIDSVNITHSQYIYRTKYQRSAEKRRNLIKHRIFFCFICLFDCFSGKLFLGRDIINNLVLITDCHKCYGQVSAKQINNIVNFTKLY